MKKILLFIFFASIVFQGCSSKETNKKKKNSGIEKLRQTIYEQQIEMQKKCKNKTTLLNKYFKEHNNDTCEELNSFILSCGFEKNKEEQLLKAKVFLKIGELYKSVKINPKREFSQDCKSFTNEELRTNNISSKFRKAHEILEKYDFSKIDKSRIRNYYEGKVKISDSLDKKLKEEIKHSYMHVGGYINKQEEYKYSLKKDAFKKRSALEFDKNILNKELEEKENKLYMMLLRASKSYIQQDKSDALYEWMEYKGNKKGLERFIHKKELSGSEVSYYQQFYKKKQKYTPLYEEYLKLKNEIAINGDKYKDLSRKLELKMNRLKDKHLGDYKNRKRKAIRNRLNSYPLEDLIIDYAYVKNIYFSIVIIKDKVYVHKLGSTKEINKAVEVFRDKIIFSSNSRGLKRKGSKTLKANKSIEELIFPEDVLIYMSRVNNVHILPDGMLYFLPFELLNYNGKLLVDAKNIFYKLPAHVEPTITYSTSFVQSHQQQEKKIEANLAIFYNPNFDAKLKTNNLLADEKMLKITQQLKQYNFESLIGTQKEYQKIKNIMSSKLRINAYGENGANEQNFYKIQKQKPSILHIASHGYYIKNHEIEESLVKSGLLLSGANSSVNKNKLDGVLTGEKILSLNLESVDLAVLSACETGLGDTDKYGNGVSGLSQAFLNAGVSNLIVSLWPVPDKETVVFMETFYKQLAKNTFLYKHHTTADERRYIFKTALKNTKNIMRKKKYPVNMWAAFILLHN